MKYQTFYDLMDLYSDDTVDLGDAGFTDADRITRLTMDKLGPVAVTTPPRRRKRPVRRMVTVLAAAALALALSVTAYAVYQARMADYLFPEATPAASAEASAETTEISATAAFRSAMSMVGYQGTPEYEAFLEWTDFLDQAGPVDYAALGVDDTWFETPENYAYLYNAVTQERADKLDEIAAKYGLTLHQSRAGFDTVQELYELLGVTPFLSGRNTYAGGYIFDDGAFKLEIDQIVDGDRIDCSLFTSVKGSFSMISGPAIEDGEEWQYTTSGGITLDLVLGETRSLILAETENTYIHMGIWCGSKNDMERYASYGLEPFDRADLEAFAETIDFAALAARFDVGALDLSQALAEKNAQDQIAAQEESAYQGQALEEFYATSMEVVEQLGQYGLTPVPEGYRVGAMDGGYAATGFRFDGYETDAGTWVSMDMADLSYYNDAQGNQDTIILDLKYCRYYADETRTASVTAAQFEALKASYEGTDGFTACQVNGWEGFYCPAADLGERTVRNASVVWLDEENDLEFTLGVIGGFDVNEQTGEIIFQNEPFTFEELIALAATVTAE